VRDYIEFFRDAMIIGIAYPYERKAASFRKEKKIFFRDPFITRTLSYWTITEFLESAIYEHIVQEHVFRVFGEIYFQKKPIEIDIITKNNNKIEIKTKKPHRRYPKDTIIIDEENIPEFLIQLSLNRKI